MKNNKHINKYAPTKNSLYNHKKITEIIFDGSVL